MDSFQFLLNEKNRYNDFSLVWNCKGEETIFKANDSIYIYFHRGGRDNVLVQFKLIFISKAKFKVKYNLFYVRNRIVSNGATSEVPIANPTSYNC